MEECVWCAGVGMARDQEGRLAECPKCEGSGELIELGATRVIAPDGTYGTVLDGPNHEGRVKVEWDDGAPTSWSLVELLKVVEWELEPNVTRVERSDGVLGYIVEGPDSDLQFKVLWDDDKSSWPLVNLLKAVLPSSSPTQGRRIGPQGRAERPPRRVPPRFPRQGAR